MFENSFFISYPELFLYKYVLIYIIYYGGEWNMNIQQLRCIVEIARVGSITKAAENLYMNQPNLSRTVIEFEKEYGVTLFIRNSQGVTLTDNGKKVVEKAEEIIKKTNDLNHFLYNNDKEKINVKLAVPRASYISVAFCDTIKCFDNNKFNISFKECNNTDILNDVMMNGYNLGIIRVPADLEAKYKKMLTSKQMQFKEIWNFKCNVVFSKNHPLAGKDKLCFNDLKEYSVLLHDDEYVPFISKEEIKKLTPSYDSSSKILIQERGSQFDILSRLTKTYMWATPIPQTLLDNHKLVMKKCIDNKQSFVDILIYPKNYSLSEFEKKFIENIFEIKYALENGENAD